MRRSPTEPSRMTVLEFEKVAHPAATKDAYQHGVRSYASNLEAWYTLKARYDEHLEWLVRA